MRRGLRAFSIFFGATFGLLTSVASAQRVEVSGFDLPELITPTSSGYYDRLLTKIFSSSGFDVHFVPGPINRARRQFLSRKTDCLLPVGDTAAKAYELAADQVLTSEPMNYSRIYVFSLKSHKKLDSIEAMKQSDIVFRLGYDIPEEVVEADIPITTVSTATNGINMLKIGRADAFMEYVPDFFLIAKQEKFEDWHYEPGLHFKDAPELVLCHKSELTQNFLAKFNLVLAEMRKDGSHAELLGPSVVAPLNQGEPAKY